MSDWKFSRDRAVHVSGLRVKFEPLPHGSRGKNVAFQLGTKRYIAIPEHVPEGLENARKALFKAGLAWADWRGSHR